jgi:hypothetical protein
MREISFSNSAAVRVNKIEKCFIFRERNQHKHWLTSRICTIREINVYSPEN